MKRINIFLAVLLAFVSIFAVGCNDGNTLKITETTHSIFYAPLYIADNLGYFADEGLKVEISLATGSDAVMTSLLNKSSHIGVLGPETVVYTHNRNTKTIAKVFGQLTACDGSFIMGRDAGEAATFSWQNLKGKHIIGGRRGGLPAMSLEYAMKQNGLKPGNNLGTDVDTVLDLTVAYNLTVPTFSGGTGDYVTMFEPTASQLEVENLAYILTPVGKQSGAIPFSVFAAMDNYMKKNPEKIQKFLRAVQRGYTYLINATDEQIVSALKPSFKTTPDVIIISSVKNYINANAYASSSVLSDSSWTLLQDVMESAGELRGRVSYTDAVDTSFAMML